MKENVDDLAKSRAAVMEGFWYIKEFIDSGSFETYQIFWVYAKSVVQWLLWMLAGCYWRLKMLIVLDTVWLMPGWCLDAIGGWRCCLFWMLFDWCLDAAVPSVWLLNDDNWMLLEHWSFLNLILRADIWVVILCFCFLLEI